MNASLSNNNFVTDHIKSIWHLTEIFHVQGAAQLELGPWAESRTWHWAWVIKTFWPCSMVNWEPSLPSPVDDWKSRATRGPPWSCKDSLTCFRSDVHTDISILFTNVASLLWSTACCDCLHCVCFVIKRFLLHSLVVLCFIWNQQVHTNGNSEECTAL